MKISKQFVPQPLREFFARYPRIALAFSGGCDSAWLFYAALACGAEPGVYYVKTPFQPAFELADALRLAEELGRGIRIIEADVLEDAEICANPADRCYLCKRRIMGAVLEAARADGYTAVMDGTNASDDAGDRPGMRALRELNVLSPLRMCGMDKALVRSLSRDAGLFTWNKPAYACLATRIPAGTEIRREMLDKVERGEAALAEMGFSGMRLRLIPKGVRLEVVQSQLPLLFEKRGEIVAALEKDFSEITLDLRPRRELEI